MSYMAEPKPIASLSSGLLARKGAARPAMRRQGLDGIGQMGGGMIAPPHGEGAFVPQDDLGWNDMGYDVDPAHDEHAPDYGDLLAGAIPDVVPPQDAGLASAADALAAMTQPPVPVMPDVVRQQAEIAERMAEPVESEAPEWQAPDAVVQEPAPDTDLDLGAQPSLELGPEPAASPAPVLSVRKRKPEAPIAAPVAAAMAAVPSGRRAAFTLRLDSDRHLKLRLATAVTGQSAQALVTAALDEMLTKIPEIEDLAGRVPRLAGR